MLKCSIRLPKHCFTIQITRVSISLPDIQRGSCMSTVSCFFFFLIKDIRALRGKISPLLEQKTKSGFSPISSNWFIKTKKTSVSFWNSFYFNRCYGNIKSRQNMIKIEIWPFWAKFKGFGGRYFKNSISAQASSSNKWAVTWDFQECGILTSVDWDESVQPPFKLRNCKWC